MSKFTSRLSLAIAFCFMMVLNAMANDSDIVNCNRAWKVVVLGSSTAYGTGASNVDSSWVGKFTAYVKRKNSQSQVYNFGIPGFTSYQNLCPTGFTAPANRPAVNSSFNITAALAIHPDAIIINMPSNDAANDYTIAEQQANFERAIRLADSAQVLVWVSTTQPRNNMSAAGTANLTGMRDWILTRFGDKAVDFWSTVANGDGTISNYYDYDYVHVNDLGHDLFYKRIKAESILDSLCIRTTPTLVARAGSDITITTPANSANLDGRASYSSLGGTITSYQWQFISGPQAAQISAPASALTSVTNLIEGRYSFALTVTDNGSRIKSDTVDIIVTSRILIDFGPEASGTPDTNGNYWNNISETQPGIKLSNAVTTANIATAISLQVINRIDGTFNTGGPGTNTGNSIGVVGDYPATATTDFSFTESSATDGQWKLSGLQTTKQYTIKFWGARSASDDRIIQIKRADQTTWQEYNGANNSIYNNAAVFTFSGKTTMTFDIKTKSGSPFGYISLIDITRTSPLQSLNIAPAARANDITVPLPATSGVLDGSGSSDDDGSITAYQWSQTSGPSTAGFSASTSAITTINNLVEGIYTFNLMVTDDSSASATTRVTVTVNSRVLFDFGPELTAGADASGKYWNNISNGLPGVKVSNAVTTGNTATPISLEIINRIDGTFNTGGPGTNTGNSVGQVGDYPSSVTNDFAFAHTSSSDGSWKISGLDSTKQYTIKFWGTRSVSDERTIRIKPSDDSLWQEYEARNNTDYNNAAVFTFTNKTQQTFDIRVKDNSAFGHISLIDIKYTNPPVICTPAINIISDQTSATCQGTAIRFSASTTSGGVLPAFQWKKNNVSIAGATDSVYVVSSLNNNDSITCELTAGTNCGPGVIATSNIIVAAVLAPVNTGIVSGPADVCPFIATSNNAVYSIAPIAGVSLYNWTVAAGATIVSGQGSNTIAVSYSSNLIDAGNISVVAAGCSNNIASSLPLTKNIPAVPGAITGPTSACGYLGTNTQAVYSIVAVPFASSYMWVAPANATIVSGQGTNSISIVFNPGFTTASLTVRAVSNCATSEPASMIISTSVISSPGIISGPAEVCAYIGTGNAVYSIRKVNGAASYIWVTPAGATITSHPAGTGINDTIINVSYNSGFVSGSSISVQAAGCILSPASSLAIVTTAPATPGAISGPTEACAYIGTNTVATYIIRKVAGANAYSWTVPAGITVSAHPSGTGINDTTIQVLYSSGFTSGNLISVKAVSCLTSNASSIAISVTAPARPGTISGPTDICTYVGTGLIATYNIRKVTAARSYNWTVPTGVTVSSHPAGTGANDTIIKVTFNSSFVSGTAITVTAVSCIAGEASSLAILKVAPATPGAISGPANACGYVGTTNTAIYSIRKVTGATSYSWTVPTGVTVSSHPAGTGANDTTIKVTYNSSFVSGSMISVQALNCLTSAASTITIQRPLPPAPGAITVIVSPCTYQNYQPMGAFSVVRVPGITYNWTVPAGSAVYHGSLTGAADTVGIVFPSNFIGGTISVTASNTCGTSSSSSSIAVTVSVPATLSLNLSGPSNPCPYMGSTTGAIYKVGKVANAQTYTWTVPSSGVSVVHPNGAGINDTIIIVNYSTAFSSGSISVSANTTCGSTPVKSIALTKAAPATPGTITANLLATCPLRKYTFTIGVLPANATSATWTLPAGTTIISGQGTATITVTFPASTLIAAISVAGKNYCGTGSAAKTLSVVLPVCTSSSRGSNTEASPEFTKTKETLPGALEITAMPNPTYTAFSFVVKSNDQQTPLLLRITDVRGKLIEMKTGILAGQTITLGANYQKGVYIGEFIQARQRTIVKLVKL